MQIIVKRKKIALPAFIMAMLASQIVGAFQEAGPAKVLELTLTSTGVVEFKLDPAAAPLAGGCGSSTSAKLQFVYAAGTAAEAYYAALSTAKVTGKLVTAVYEVSTLGNVTTCELEMLTVFQ